MTFQLSGSFAAVPGRRDELAAHLLEAAALLQPNPACLLYLVATTDDPDEVAVTEVWRDEQSHSASLQDPGIPELIGRARPSIAGVKGQTRLQVLGGKGLPASGLPD